MRQKVKMTTLERLKAKANSSVSEKVRMPSIRQISKLLNELDIEHTISDNTNVVEYRSAGRTYVNSRHNGKTGLVLTISEPYIQLDTSDSYYSWNTWRYANELVELIKSKNEKN